MNEKGSETDNLISEVEKESSWKDETSERYESVKKFLSNFDYDDDYFISDLQIKWTKPGGNTIELIKSGKIDPSKILCLYDNGGVKKLRATYSSSPENSTTIEISGNILLDYLQFYL